MHNLNDFAFAIYELTSKQSEALNPGTQATIYGGRDNRGLAENAVKALLSVHLDYSVCEIDHRRAYPLRHGLGIDKFHRTRGLPQEAPPEIINRIEKKVKESIEEEPPVDSLGLLEREGIPDLMAWQDDDAEPIFVEVKFQDESLHQAQIDWFSQFDFFDRWVAIVFESTNTRDKYIRNTTVDELLDSNEDEEDDPESMTQSQISDRLAVIEKGDRIRFNEFTTPLKVTGTDVTKEGKRTLTGVEVKSVHGKRYVLSNEGDYYLDPWQPRRLTRVEIVDDK